MLQILLYICADHCQLQFSIYLLGILHMFMWELYLSEKALHLFSKILFNSDSSGKRARENISLPLGAV